MPVKKVRSRFRVEVTPRSKGDFGIFRIHDNNEWTEQEWETACDEIADQIKRHVDGLPSYSHRGVSVEWDTEKVCEFCGSAWTSSHDRHNDGCCSKDAAIAEAEEVEALAVFLAEKEQEIVDNVGTIAPL